MVSDVLVTKDYKDSGWHYIQDYVDKHIDFTLRVQGFLRRTLFYFTKIKSHNLCKLKILKANKYVFNNHN